MSETSFCPRCQQTVLLTREKIDACLAVILLIFTGGIGLIIYLAVYYNKPKSHCVHCGTKIKELQPIPYTHQSQPQIQNSSSPTHINANEQILGARPNYCAFCGEKIDVGMNYCQNCGSKVV